MDSKGVMIIAEVREGGLATISTELAGIGHRLAEQLGEELSALLVGHGITSFAQELLYLGASKVYVVDDPILVNYQNDPYTSVVAHVCKEACPNVLLFGHTRVGRDLAPRLAFRLETGVAVDCIGLEVDPESKAVLMTRPVYGGNAHTTLVIDSARPQMATVRARTQVPAARDSSRKGEIINFPAKLDPSALRVKVVDIRKEDAEGLRLEDAAVVVAGGRGMGSAEGFKALEELAIVLGGTVGASRAPVNAGWVSSDLQVGLSGRTVGPDVYIAVGVSGAMQHMAGCLAAKSIVAINQDPEAPIFSFADFGAVGDWKQILPAFLEKCKALLLQK